MHPENLKNYYMSFLSELMAQYQEPQKVKALGVYPYFRPIESDQDTVVQINGKPVLMFGSWTYKPSQAQRSCHQSC